MKSAAKYAFSLGLAVLLLLGLWRVFRGVDLDELWRALLGASWLGLGAAMLLNLLQNVPRVLRWRVLLQPLGRRIPLRPMTSAVIIGYMTTFLIPGRLGELVRPALLSSGERVPLGPCMGSVMADRITDGLALVALFAFAAFVQPLEGAAAASAGTIRTVAVVLLAVVGTALAVLLALGTWREGIERWLERRHRTVAWIGRTALSFAQGMEALRRPRLMLPVAFHSLACWLIIAAGTWVGLRACGVGLSFSSVLVLMPLLALGIAIPTPGNVGGYHAVMAVALSEWFGVGEAVALGAGILMQYVVVMLPFLVLGPVLMVVEGLSWRHLLELGRQVRDLGAAADPGSGVPGGDAVEGTTP